MQYIKPTYIPRSEHSFSRSSINQAAFDVLYKLDEAGYEVFLVGGGVRDILLGRIPKDFDIVTNAMPDQIKKVFKRCRLIGRRFILAHVYSQNEIIEVATFRTNHERKGDSLTKTNGQIIRDNVYGGSIIEDAQRRDFTINALYYKISDFSLFDYADGISDLKTETIRLIGEPLLRYQEDPVRMLRAIRFAAKLDFNIDSLTAEPIPQLAHLLNNVPPARLFEEFLKLFLSGHALQSFEKLRQYDLFQYLFPYTEECLNEENSFTLIRQALYNTDQRKQENKPVAPGFLLAALLWKPLLSDFKDKSVKIHNQQEALLESIRYLLSKQQKKIAVPRRISVLIQDIWLFQQRLTKQRRNKKKSLNLLIHPHFRASYDFLLLRAKTGENHIANDAQWWTDFIKTNQEPAKKLLLQIGANKKRKHYKPNKNAQS